MVVAVEHLVQLGLQRLGGLDILGVAGDLALLDQMLQLGHHPGVEVLGDLVGAVPVGVVRPHHGGALAGPTPFVVPQLEPDPVQRVAELGRLEQGLGQGMEGLARLGELLVVDFDQAVVLGIEVVHPFLVVAGGAGGTGEEVLSGDPLGTAQIHLRTVDGELDAVLGLLVDLLLRVVGTRVALAAGLGLTGLDDRELVPRMAGRAGAVGAVRIEPSDAGVGPGGRIQLAFLKYLHLGAVALPAAHHRGGEAALREALGDEGAVALHHLGEQVVQGAEDLARLGLGETMMEISFLTFLSSWMKASGSPFSALWHS